MWFLYGKISLISLAFYLTLCARTSISTQDWTYLHDFEDNRWQRTPCAEPDGPSTELLGLHHSPLVPHPRGSSMASEILNYPGHSMLQPTLTGQDIHDSSQASCSVDEQFCPDLQVDTRRIDGELGPRKRIKHSHRHSSWTQETTSDSALKPGSSHDHTT
ncbi:hypothetical protein PtA15_5A383 [Puccinia triticina]|uniref:Uncharacterized protein n=1 Tax=Puccinia triticina TaxID=208348 RepID=A0ABY7CJA0_9BASI|nr:uncharacterized protein PtA15_5A383 [Puccinia triticina]WAQ84810.1 hypothetical protein PtA15_5A383 [Puccinia triticina]